MRPPIYIGCAGWNIPRQATRHFPEQGTHLQRYSAVFNAVEINSSFYRPHQPKTYARWAESVPDDFRFSVKLPRSMTHEQRLQADNDLLPHFFQAASALGDKLGCILMQLPPSLSFDLAVTDTFFDRLQGHYRGMVACEARHASWFGEAATGLLRTHGVTRVIADPPQGQPGPHIATTETVYRRLHGSPQIYYSSYDTAVLDDLRCALAHDAGAARTSWCIFDNTAAGEATMNAYALKVD